MRARPMRYWSGLLLAALLPAAQALTLSASQTGGFYADGSYQNLPTFQNYFVGYGTTPGMPRTAERRSFFVFDVPTLAPGEFITGATLKLRLPVPGGLIFGKGPGVPGVDTIVDDPMETFAVGLLSVPSSVVLSPTLTVAEATTLFGFMTTTPVAAPTPFTPGMVLPPSGDSGPPIVSIALDGMALGALNAAMGGKVILSGWMPTWSEDLRPSPTPPPFFFEASELIFGLTDVHVLAILTPKLDLATTVVPEPSALWMLATGVVALLLRTRDRRLRAPGRPVS
jgi:hypothetical protein